MMVLGVDPGVEGAWAIIKDGHLVALNTLPTAGDAARRMVSAPLWGDNLSYFIEREGKIDRAVIERVGAMPGQGVSSMFRFGRAVGTIDGVIGAFNIPVQYVTPSVWKRHFGLSSDKEASRQLAIQTWPEIAHLAFRRKADHGKAEAALIALWAYRAALAAGEAV